MIVVPITIAVEGVTRRGCGKPPTIKHSYNLDDARGARGNPSAAQRAD
jgi:hypothetical protein